MTSHPFRPAVILAATISLANFPAHAQPSRFVGLTFTGHTPDFTVTGLSANGAVVIGIGGNANNQLEALRWAGKIQGLGFLGDGGRKPVSYASGISADGSVIVGTSSNATSHGEAFRWTNGVMQGLGYINGGGGNGSDPLLPYSNALAVSADGAVVVGFGSNASNQHEAFRWSGGALQGLGHIDGGGPDPTSLANGVSADGAVIVGLSSNASGRSEAFRWRDGVMQRLGFIDGGGVAPASASRAVSADGSTVIGDSTNAAGAIEAFRWTGSGPVQGLGFIAGGGPTPYSSVSAVNSNGSVIVGVSRNAGNQLEAFRWSGGAMQALGHIDGGGAAPASAARAVSADGSVVVGESTNAAGTPEAFRWTAKTQMRSLSSLLAAANVDIGAWQLTTATGISADGAVIVGQGGNGVPGQNQGWYVRYVEAGPVPPGVLTLKELTETLTDMERVPRQAQAVTVATLADQRYIAFNQCAPDRSDRYCVALTGAANFWTGGDRHGRGGRGSVALAVQATPGWSLGVNANTGQDRYDLRQGGSDRIRSTGGGVFSVYAPAATGWRVLGALAMNSLDLDVDRHSLNGINSVVSSRGSRGGNAVGALFNAGWGVRLSDTLVATPFAELQWTRTRLRAYTESGGPFPIAWSGQAISETVGRLGSELRWNLRQNVALNLSAAWAHHLAGQADRTTGTLISVGPVEADRPSFSRDWGELSAGIDWQPRPGTRIGTAVTSQIGRGNHPDVAVRLGMAVSF